MNEIGWKKHAATPAANYPEVPDIDLQFKAKHLKVKSATSVTLSFNGKDDHATVLAADGLQTFADVNKGKIWLKGAGAAEITAWDGN